MARDVIDYQPSDDSEEVSDEVYHQTEVAVFQYINDDTSADVQFTIEGTHLADADSFDDATQVDQKTITSDSTGSARLNEPWDVLRVKAKPQSSPNGDDVRVKEHTLD